MDENAPEAIVSYESQLTKLREMVREAAESLERNEARELDLEALLQRVREGGC